MTQSASAAYQTQEAKVAGAKPQYYIAFWRTSKVFAAADYAAGTHDNTEFASSNLQLSVGETSGSWTSEVIDTGHLTPNTIIDYITWTETLNDGTVTVEIKSAAASGDVPAASAVEYTNATLDHTARYRYIQIIITFTTTDASSTVTALTVRHKALIPRDEYRSLGSISYGTGIDFTNISAGGASVELDNTAYQWDKRNSASYIYQKSFYFQKLEIWAGFELADTTIEWLLQYIGEIESLTTGSGGDAEGSASISTRDFLFRKLANTIIGTPTAAGAPSPYMAGIRYRVPCIETDADNHIFSFYCQQSITSIDETYTKDSISNKWVVASPSSTSTANKTVTFANDPGANVSVDITVNANNHPCDWVTDILTNELSLNADQYDATSISTTETQTSDLVASCSFDNISVLEAMKQIARILDAAVFIENGVFKLIHWYPDVDETLTFTDALIQGIQITDSISEIQNLARIYYGNYNENKTDYSEISLTDSVTDYGELPSDDLDYTYEAPITLISSTEAEANIGHFLDRQSNQKEVIVVNLPLEILRVEIMDVIAITAAKHSFTLQKCQVYSKDITLDSYNGKITVIQYSGAQFMYFQDSGATEDLFYFVDDPVPSSQEDYKSYFY